eukprot:3532986-Amphidinium_carterae.2
MATSWGDHWVQACTLPELQFLPSLLIFFSHISGVQGGCLAQPTRDPVYNVTLCFLSQLCMRGASNIPGTVLPFDAPPEVWLQSMTWSLG